MFITRSSSNYDGTADSTSFYSNASEYYYASYYSPPDNILTHKDPRTQWMRKFYLFPKVDNFVTLPQTMGTAVWLRHRSSKPREVRFSRINQYKSA